MSTRNVPDRRRSRQHADHGFTLIEVIFALVLSSIIVGVVAAAMITSLNVATSTTGQVGDSTDAGLISSFLLRDAQSAGATDPLTALRDTTLGTLGVIVPPDPPDPTASPIPAFTGCTQPSSVVVRFSWIDPTDRTRPVVVYYSLDGAPAQLTRRLCKNGTTTDVVLGTRLSSAVATCDPSCAGAPASVSLRLTGSGTGAPFDYTLRASLRDDAQATPTSANSAPVPLLALGARPPAACPNLTLAGTGVITVRGSVAVEESCTGSGPPIGGDQALLRPTGIASPLAGINDPYIARTAPPDTCASGGPNPATIGMSAGRDAVVVHPQTVSIVSDTVFAPGRYVFCQGLDVTAGKVTGRDVLWYVKTGAVTIGPAATVDLGGREIGLEANLLLWVAEAGQTIQIDGGPRVTSLRGVMYAPTSTLVVSSVNAINIGGIVVRDMTIGGAGTARVGLPLPGMTVDPSVLPLGEVGVPYASTTLVASGAEPHTWSASGLPAGLAIDSSTGVISGTPTAEGTFADVVVTVVDNTAEAASFDYPVTINAAMSVAWAEMPNGEVGVAYPPTTPTASGGTPPFTWSATSLPTGLSIDASTGTISGTPTAAGTFPLTVTATGELSGTATKVYSVVVHAALSAVWPTMPNGQVGVAYPPTTMTATEGATPYTWSATGLPAGVSIDATTGTVAGTPTTAGTFAVVVSVIDALGAAQTKSYTVTVNPPLSAAWPTMSNGRVGVAYTTTMWASGGTTPYVWSATGLPPGLTLGPANGTVSGTPTEPGAYTVTIMVTDALGASLTKSYAITIAPAGVCPGQFAGWKGEYYGNVALEGGPWVCRDDPTVNFDWATGAAGEGLPADNFSVRWTRTQAFAAGTYTFSMGSDNGSRLYVDGVLVLDRWAGQDAPTPVATVAVNLSDGSHTIVMEYYDRDGSARATLTWVASNPASCTGTAAGWYGQYFSNISLTGPPAACRADAHINFDWASGAAMTGMPTDRFSVRWTKTETFAAGAYNFALGTDDGGRLYLDGELILDRWVDQLYPAPPPSVTRAVSAGPHTLVVEYYDRTSFARATLVTTLVNPPSTPTLAFSAFTNAYWSGTGSTVYYRSTATGAFTTTASSTDAAWGIASYGFPALGTKWTSTPGANGVNTYSFTATPTAPPTKHITATNNAGVTSAGAPFTVTNDSTIPAGTVTYTDGVTANTTVSVSFTASDAGSGIASRLLQRQSAPLTGSTCGTYGEFETLANGTNPTSPVVSTVTLGRCYRYRYVVTDNVGNVRTAGSENVVMVRKTYANTVLDTTGLVSYWRLGEEAATETETVSSDSFTGPAGQTLQVHTGAVGATWTKHAQSTTDAVITNVNRIRKNGMTSLRALYYSSGVPASANYTVRADVFVASSLTDDAIGVVGRLDTAVSSGTYYSAVYDRFTQKWSLYKTITGTRTLLGQSTQQELTDGATYPLVLDMVGSTIRLLVNGVQRVSVVDADIPATGRGGVVLGGAGSNTSTSSDTVGMHLDNFAVNLAPVTSMLDAKGVNSGSLNRRIPGVPGALIGDTNTALQLDGVNDYGTVARQIDGDFSIELWFLTTTGGIGPGEHWWQAAGLVDAAVNSEGGGNPDAGDFGIALTADGRVVAGTGSPDTSIRSSLGYKDGAYHHVVFTRTRTSGALALYIDGALVASGTGPTALLNGAPAITFGRIQSGGNYFTGALDEVAIYNTALNAATVTAHFYAGK